MRVRDQTNAIRTVTAIAVRDAANTLRSATQGVVRDAAGALRVFFSALSATASPNNVVGYASTNSSDPITTNSATATPAGGTAPFTYAWSGTAGWTITSPASASTAFTSPPVSPGDVANGDFTCTITDASGAVATTNPVSANVVNLGGGGGEITP